MSAESLSFASTPSSPPSPSTPSTPGFRASFGSFSISLTFDLGGLGAEEAGGPTNRNSIASSVSSASSTNSSSSVGSNGHGNGGGPGSSRSSARFDRVISSDGNGLRLDLTGIEDAGSNNKPSWSPLPHEEPFGLEDTAQEDHLYDDGRLQLNGDEGDTVTAAAATLEADVIAKPSSRRLKTFLYSPTTASFASSASSSLHDLGLTLTNSENGKLELGAMAIDGRPFTGSGGAGGSGARRTGLGARAAAAARLEEINTARANSATNYSDRLSPLSSAGSSLRRPATASPTTMSAPASPRIWLNSPWTGSRAGSSHNYHPFYHFGDAASSTDERPSSSKMLMMSKLGGISAQARRRKPIRPRSGHSKAFGLVGVKAAGPGGAVTPPPPLTQRELEEFEALPIAIRRKV